MENSKTNKKIESDDLQNKSSASADIPTDASQKVDANSIKKDTPLISVNKLIQVGAHIGLSPWKWNPKMKPYIYAKRANNYVIDIVKSLLFLKRAYTFLQSIAQEGGKILIVGTRGKMVRDLIEDESKRIQCYCVTQRWLGGTLTNFKIIKKSIKKMNDNLQAIQDGSISTYTKKEQLMISKDTDKLVKFYGGIRTMRKLPAAVVIIDPVNDLNAVLEARKLNIPIVALANTNADPALIDFIIPMNNNSIKSVALVLNILVDAVAVVNNEETKVIGKNEDDIVLIEQPIRKPRANIQHKKYSRN